MSGKDMGFLICSAISLIFLGIGIWALTAKTAVSFFSGVKPPEVKDVRRYNRAVACLWFAYAAAFELLALPLLFLERHPSGFLWCLLGIPAISIALVLAYTRILARHRKD